MDTEEHQSDTSARRLSARTSLARREAIGRAAKAGLLGISALILPEAAAAVSTGLASTAATGIQGITVDDSGSVLLTGHDVTYRVAFFRADGTPFTSEVSVLLTVRIDDGTAGGAGSVAVGTRIDGEEISDLTVVVENGSVNISVDFPVSSTYLIGITTTPASVNHPNGIVLSVAVT